MPTANSFLFWRCASVPRLESPRFGVFQKYLSFYLSIYLSIYPPARRSVSQSVRSVHPSVLIESAVTGSPHKSDSNCAVFSLYTRPHKLRPTMVTLSKLVQTSTFQTPPTPLPLSVDYVRIYRLVSYSSQMKFSPQVMAVLIAQRTNTLS